MSESKITETAKDIAGKAFDKLQEHTAPLNTALMNRFGSPFFYSFLVSWALINWERIAITIAGTGELEKRITVAKELPSTFFGVEHATTYFIPFFSTLIIVFASPYINIAIDKFHTAAFRSKYIHTAMLEADKYNADTSALSAKIGYEMAGAKERLRIEADNVENYSRIEIANLNLNSAKENLKQISDSIKLQQENYDDNVKSLKNVTESITIESEKLNKLTEDISVANERLANLNKKIISKHATIDEITNKPIITKMGLSDLVRNGWEIKDPSSHKT